MKKLLLILALFPIFLFAQEQVTYWDYNDVGWWTTTKDTTLTVKEMGVEDKIIDISYRLDSSPYSPTWAMYIQNKADKAITVKWMKSQINSSRMVLGETSMLLIGSETPDDIIYPGDILYKEVSSINMARNKYIRPFYLSEAKSVFKKKKEPQYKDTDIVICIEIEGEEKIYKFTLNGVYNGKRKK